MKHPCFVVYKKIDSVSFVEIFTERHSNCIKSHYDCMMIAMDGNPLIGEYKRRVELGRVVISKIAPSDAGPL